MSDSSNTRPKLWWTRKRWWAAGIIGSLLVIGLLNPKKKNGTDQTAAAEATSEQAAKTSPAKSGAPAPTTNSIPRKTIRTTAATPSTKAGPDVLWDDYAPNLRDRIDTLTLNTDCAGLQREFNIADSNSTATRRRTGHSNVDLMRFIEFSLGKAGCR